MWEDLLNKPKQRKFFRKFIVYLMNVEVDYNDELQKVTILVILSQEYYQKNRIILTLYQRYYHKFRHYIWVVVLFMISLTIHHRSSLRHHKGKQK